jgi:VIT1/CCC1 family predicted Fe2+/Mn2+ transporter
MNAAARVVAVTAGVIGLIVGLYAGAICGSVARWDPPIYGLRELCIGLVLASLLGVAAVAVGRRLLPAVVEEVDA